MPTPFNDIYSRAIFRFADYEFLKHDIPTREDILWNYLRSAKTEFAPICEKNLDDYNEDLQEFNIELNDDEIEILALGVAYHWLSFKTLNSRALQNVLNSKDYSYYSPATLLKEVRALRDTVKKEFQSAMRKYSYNHNSVSDLRP